MLRGIAHSAVRVADVDAAVAWYRDVLGMTVLSPPYRMEGDEITRDMGELVPAPVVVKAAIVGFDGGDDRVLEVIEYPGVGCAPAEPPSVTGLGVTHVGLVCDDVAGLRTTWFADPWANVFILVEKARRPDRPYYRQF